MSSVKTLYEEHLTLWDAAREEARGVALDTEEWWLLFHYSADLAGWCTQILANNCIRSNELPQLRTFPALDETGPYAAWIRDIRVSKPRVWDYVRNLEETRLTLLRVVDAS